MDNRPRLATTAEKADLALLLAKRRYPHYPFLSDEEMDQVVQQVLQAALTVLDGTSASPKQLFVHWKADPTAPECLYWFNGALEPAPEWDLHFDEPPI